MSNAIRRRSVTRAPALRASSPDRPTDRPTDRHPPIHIHTHPQPPHFAPPRMRVRARIRAPAPHVYSSSLRPSVAQAHASTPYASSSRGAGAPCARALSTARALRTDGVFHALTNHKISMPWIEALERSRARTASEGSGGQEQEHIGGGVKDMTPKRMADSYHSVVSFRLGLRERMWKLICLSAGRPAGYGQISG